MKKKMKKTEIIWKKLKNQRKKNENTFFSIISKNQARYKLIPTPKTNNIFLNINSMTDENRRLSRPGLVEFELAMEEINMVPKEIPDFGA